MAMPGAKISPRTIERLSLYRRTLLQPGNHSGESIHSHRIATLCGVNAAQVRRDLMVTGCQGNPRRGYSVKPLLTAIGELLDGQTAIAMALVGFGALGRALVNHLRNRSSRLQISAAFDSNPKKNSQVLYGVRCYPPSDIPRVLNELGIEIAIVAVPGEAAQAMTNLLVTAGVKGILNFAPATIRVPKHVVVQHVDIIVLLEKVAFYTRGSRQPRKEM